MIGGGSQDRFNERGRQCGKGAAKKGNLSGCAGPADPFGVNVQIGTYDLVHTGPDMVTRNNHSLVAVDALKRTSGVG
jgi:hypothetical protein